MAMKSSRQGAAISVAELLARSAWFPQLDERARAQVASDTLERTIAAGDALIRHGDTAIGWYGVLEGVLKWSATARDGRSVTLGGLTVGSWFGEGSLLHGKPIQADIIALRHSRVALVPKETFDWLYRTQLSFAHFLLHQINERLHGLMGDLAAHRLFSADAQVARALVGLLHPWLHPGGDRHLEISQEEIANLAGLSRQRCNQALSRMKSEALVRIDYGGITLLDLERLARMAVE
ncbi:MAG TPA: Crp/Fnr family transcriptional regulator [Ideonella sp.]|nr:Crp/Fnr family transcriptional regulator [Ideonella sp.]